MPSPGRAVAAKGARPVSLGMSLAICLGLEGAKEPARRRIIGSPETEGAHTPLGAKRPGFQPGSSGS